MSVPATMLPDQLVLVSDTSVSFQVGIPWHRSIPWASIDDLVITLDGAQVDPASIRVDGRAIAELRDDADTYWFIQHRPRLDVTVSNSRWGSSVAVGLEWHLRLPYPRQPDGSPLRISPTVRRSLATAR